jgi:hypothetical protein
LLLVLSEVLSVRHRSLGRGRALFNVRVVSGRLAVSDWRLKGRFGGIGGHVGE